MAEEGMLPHTTRPTTQTEKDQAPSPSGSPGAAETQHALRSPDGVNTAATTSASTQAPSNKPISKLTPSDAAFPSEFEALFLAMKEENRALAKQNLDNKTSVEAKRSALMEREKQRNQAAKKEDLYWQQEDLKCREWEAELDRQGY